MKAYQVIAGVAVGVLAGKVLLGLDSFQFRLVQPLRETLDPALGGDVFLPEPDEDGFL